MKKIFPFLILLLLLAGCASGSSTSSQPPQETSPGGAAPAGSPTRSASAPTPAPEAQASQPLSAPPAAPPANSSGLTQSSGPLTVQLFSDEDVEVSEPAYVVSGRAPAGTVLSINDEIILVDQSQAFSVSVPLEDGPNLIEIVASDNAGNEVSFMLTVTYASQE